MKIQKLQPSSCASENKWIVPLGDGSKCLGIFGLEVFKIGSMTMIVLGFAIPTQLHQLSCISSSQVEWMHFDEMLKCRSAHQQW
jgi:hypothetical protein